MSPRYLGPPPPPPRGMFLFEPPNSCRRIPFLTLSIPQIEGASDWARSSYISGLVLSSWSLDSITALLVLRPSFLASSSSSSAPPTPPTPGMRSLAADRVDLSNASVPLVPILRWTTSRNVLKRFLIVLVLGFTRTGTLLKIPVMMSLSPGLATSTSSSYTLNETVWGV